MVTSDPYDQPALRDATSHGRCHGVFGEFLHGQFHRLQQNFRFNEVSVPALTSTTSLPIPSSPTARASSWSLCPAKPRCRATWRGKSGSPASAPAGTYTAGNVWVATVTAVDPFYNPVTDASANGNVWFNTTDPYDVDGTTQPLVNGTTSFTIQMVQAATQTVTMTHSGSLTAAVETNIPIIAGLPNRILVLLPGETYLPGKPPYTPGGAAAGGKFTPDTTTSQVAGTHFNVTAYATDAYWNQAVSNSTVTINVATDPNPVGVGNLNFVNGTTIYSVTLFKANDYHGFSHAVDAVAAGFVNPNYTTPTLTLFPDQVGVKKVRMIFNGEVRAPGTVAGKTGAPIGTAPDNHFIAGAAVPISIDGTDTWGNILQVGSTVTFTTDDSYDAPDPRPVTLINGTSSFTHVFITQRTSDIGTTPSFTTVTASTNNYTGQTEAITVDADNTVRHLQVLVQGETSVPGSAVWPAPAKIGQADGDGDNSNGIQNFTAGQNICVTVLAVDNYYNLIELPAAGQPRPTLLRRPERVGAFKYRINDKRRAHGDDPT